MLQYLNKDTFFAHENMKKMPSKVAHNRPKFFFQYYSHLFNKRGGWNKRGGGAKNAKSLNVEVGINVEGGKI